MLYGILNIPHSYYVIYMNKQLVFGVIAVVFATAMIASLVVDQANANLPRSTKQQPNNKTIDKVSQNSVAKTKARSTTTAGAASGVTGSGNNAAQCTNTNNGGNAAS